LSVPFICHIIVIDSVSAAVPVSAVPALLHALPVHMQLESHASLILYAHRFGYGLYSSFFLFASFFLYVYFFIFINFFCLLFFVLYPCIDFVLFAVFYRFHSTPD